MTDLRIDVAEGVATLNLARPDKRNALSEPLVEELIAKNPDKAEQARAKPALIGWFVGQVMKASGGKANPQDVNDLLKRRIG